MGFKGIASFFVMAFSFCLAAPRREVQKVTECVCVHREKFGGPFALGTGEAEKVFILVNLVFPLP